MNEKCIYKYKGQQVIINPRQVSTNPERWGASVWIENSEHMAGLLEEPNLFPSPAEAITAGKKAAEMIIDHRTRLTNKRT